MTHRRRIRLRALTRAQVLALVSVVGLVILLASVTVHTAGRYVRQRACAAQLRHLGSLLGVYTSAHNGYLPSFWNERWIGELGLVGNRWGNLPDDANPDIPVCWSEPFPLKRVAGEERRLVRSGAPFLLCPSDFSRMRSDQGCYASYRGIAKYGWWLGGTSPRAQWLRTRHNVPAPCFRYRRFDDVEAPSRGVMLGEMAPSPPRAMDRPPIWPEWPEVRPQSVTGRHFGGGHILHFDGHVRRVSGAEARRVETWEPDYAGTGPGK
ncbi:hypothetical protein HQ560_15415 [bacterium]|nr:hypothetical protein [bacterium]